jgi:hypothetical protein
MPKTDIDYSNTIIYKITCKDSAIIDVYVGHTTNFVQRKHAHKQSCKNIKSHNYKLKLYEVIRANGGWNNWKMEIINFFNCKDHYEARKKEQEYFISLNATLNSIEPMPKPKVILPKHIKIMESVTNIGEKPLKYGCKLCNLITSNKKDYNKHILTIKHKNKQECEIDIIDKPILQCKICNKQYKSRNGIWKHAKNCNIDNTKVDTNKNIPISISENNTSLHTIIHDNEYFKKLILEVIKSNNELQIQNNELQKQMFEICKHNLPRNH